MTPLVSIADITVHIQTSNLLCINLEFPSQQHTRFLYNPYSMLIIHRVSCAFMSLLQDRIPEVSQNKGSILNGYEAMDV
jgi:hypothetical protein